MTKKTKIILIVIAVIVILLIPIKTTLDDGGTVVYNSLTYKIIDWHEENITYDSGYKTGRDVHLFPNNFKTVKYYSDIDAGERERNFGVARVIDGECISETKEKFYTKEEIEYYFPCEKSENVIVVFNDKTTMRLPYALSEEKVTLDDLLMSGIRFEEVNPKTPTES